MPSLRELQQEFAAAVLAGDGVPPPFATVPPERADGAPRRSIAAPCSPTIAMRWVPRIRW